MDKNNSKIEKLLVVMLLNSLKGLTLADKAKQLNIAGFSNMEIANFLETKPNLIAQALYDKRKGGKKK